MKGDEGEMTLDSIVLLSCHDTMAYVDGGSLKLCDVNLNKEGKVVYSIEEGKITLFVESVEKYISGIYSDGTVTLSEQKCYFDIVIHSDDTFSIKNEKGFLSARPSNDFVLVDKIGRWEHFHKRSIILYGGATWYAEKFYYQYKRRDNIGICANKEGGGEFHCKEIVALKDIPYLKKYFIVICTSWREFLKVKVELQKQGLMEFGDFWYWEAFVKKIAVVHGNCYRNAYSEFLTKSQDFTSEYFLYPTRPVHVNNKENKLDELLIRNCDLFIHQDIRKENKFSYYYSDEYILPLLKKECKHITVPNLVSFAEVFFPKEYMTNMPGLKLANAEQDQLFIGNRIIDESFEKGNDIDGIIRDFCNTNIVSQDEKERCKAHFYNKMESLIKREHNWDVKISDYILSNYREYKLFVDWRHPNLVLMGEICRRIGKALNLGDIDDIQLDFDLEYVGMFIMPWVKESLELEFSDNYVRCNNRINLPNRNKLCDGKMDLHEYIREYVYWKFGNII